MGEAQDELGWRVGDGFALDAFLQRPLVARVATIGRHGPTIRPVWYLWEEQRFWWLTGAWSALERQLRRDPRVALVVDSYNAASGEILQGIARGRAEVVGFDPARARRWGKDGAAVSLPAANGSPPAESRLRPDHRWRWLYRHVCAIRRDSNGVWAGLDALTSEDLVRCNRG